ncbi:hypothetical protein AB6A40_008222 [Gnathostoma spinigerum]|uniref:Uncharacterized protein n=1 Tax=Gnathostoma spinigerum TaxID=75299 RepID=A0ABD6ENR6_9BILA
MAGKPMLSFARVVSGVEHGETMSATDTNSLSEGVAAVHGTAATENSASLSAASSANVVNSSGTSGQERKQEKTEKSGPQQQQAHHFQGCHGVKRNRDRGARHRGGDRKLKVSGGSDAMIYIKSMGGRDFLRHCLLYSTLSVLIHLHQ